MQIEADVQLARLLAGLHGTKARREVSERANSIMEAGLQLQLIGDRLTAMMEAAQVIMSDSYISGTITSGKITNKQWTMTPYPEQSIVRLMIPSLLRWCSRHETQG